MIREAYESAAGLFVNTVEQVRPTQWEQPGLGIWTVRDLVGHTSRALLTVEMYLAKPAAQREVMRPVDYSALRQGSPIQGLWLHVDVRQEWLLAPSLLRQCGTSRLGCWHK